MSRPLTLGSKGHEIVAAIAETHLTDTARKRIKDLLPRGTTLADASTWPDKAGRQIPDMDPYHFVTFRKTRTHTSSRGIVSCATALSKLLRGICRVLKSPDGPRNEKRTALRFIVHLVGDIHQPLHAGFAEDRGGNSVDVRFNGRKVNLHSLWDTAFVELEEGTPGEIAARIQAVVTSDDVQQWQQGTPGRMGAGVVGCSEDACVLAACFGRNQWKLQRTGTRYNTHAIGGKRE